MTYRTLVQAIAAFLLSVIAPASAWGIDAFERAFPDEEAPIENPGWTCSVRDGLEGTPVPLVFPLSKESSGKFEMTVRDRYELRFTIGRSDSDGLPAGSSGDFITLHLQDKRDPSRERTVFQGVHVMNPCDPSAGIFREVAQDPGLEIECVPDGGFTAYFGDMKNECASYVDPIARRMELVQRGMAEFDGGTSRNPVSFDTDENGAAYRATAAAAAALQEGLARTPSGTGEQQASSAN